MKEKSQQLPEAQAAVPPTPQRAGEGGAKKASAMVAGDPAAHNQLAEKLVAAFLAEEPVAAGTDYFSPSDAFFISKIMADRLAVALPQRWPSAKIIGKKIGRNDRVGHIATPIYGFGSGHGHPLPRNVIGLEPELAVVWGAPPPMGITAERDFYQALKASGAMLVVGVEILANRFTMSAMPWTDATRPDFSLVLADHLHQWGYAVGAEQYPIDPDRPYHQLPFTLRLGGTTIPAKGARLAFGNPLNMLWQFYQLSQGRGEVLKQPLGRPSVPFPSTDDFRQGDVITLGSLLGGAVPYSHSPSGGKPASGDKPNVVFSFGDFAPLVINWAGA